MNTANRNGWIRLAIIVPPFVHAVAINAEWPVYIAVGIMIIFQIANGEGFD